MRTSFPSSGINRYSRPDLAFPNRSLPPSLLSYFCLSSPGSHHVLLSFMSIHVSEWWSLFFFCLSNLRRLSFSTFSLTRKFYISSPLELYRHIIVMYHPPNTCPLPIDPSHCRHFDLPNTSVTVIMSQGSGVVYAGSLWLNRTPTHNITKSHQICYAWDFQDKSL